MVSVIDQYYCVELTQCSMFLCSTVQLGHVVLMLLYGHCCSPVFKTGNNSPLEQRVVQTKARMLTRKSHDRPKAE